MYYLAPFRMIFFIWIYLKFYQVILYVCNNEAKPKNKQLVSSSLYSFNIFTFFSLQPPQPHSFLITSQCKELLRACSPSAKCKFFIAVEKC